MIDETIEVRLARMEKDLEYLTKTTEAICKKLDEKFVTQEQLKVFEARYAPIIKIVYGLAGCVFLSVVYQIIKLVVN